MDAATIARGYAEALLDLGRRHGTEQAFADAFAELAQIIEAEPSVRTFLDAPTVEPEDKQRALRTALEGRVPQLFMNFVLVVIAKRRQRLLATMAREYQGLLDRHLGRVHAEVTLAHEADERLEEDITAALSRRLGRTVVPHLKVDPAILGGMIVRFEGRVLDASLRRRLAGMRRRMMAAELAPAPDA